MHKQLKPDLQPVDKATPGPWHVYRCSHVGEGEACGIATKDFDHSASSYSDVVCDLSYDECHHPMTLADAQLIAAAPDLLALALRTLPILATLSNCGWVSAEFATEVLEQTRAAISKATEGGQ